MIKPRFIAIDFDGTCTSHEYPEMGKDIGAIPVLKRLVDAGHTLILNTMRGGETFSEAILWFEINGITLNHFRRHPTQGNWTSRPKCYADLYIDDAALGCPLIHDEEVSLRPFVDWKEVEKRLEATDYLEPVPTLQWWGYLHIDGGLHAKRYFDERDTNEARESPFVDIAVGPFDATDRDDALKQIAAEVGIEYNPDIHK